MKIRDRNMGVADPKTFNTPDGICLAVRGRAMGVGGRGRAGKKNGFHNEHWFPAKKKGDTESVQMCGILEGCGSCWDEKSQQHSHLSGERQSEGKRGRHSARMRSATGFCFIKKESEKILRGKTRRSGLGEKTLGDK